jgi:hypothetical protein
MRYIFIAILLLVNHVVFSQKTNTKEYKKLHSRVGIRTYMDYIIVFEPNIAFMDQNSNYIYNVSFSTIFYNKYYTGLFFEKKSGTTEAHAERGYYPQYVGNNGGNLRYGNAGVVLGGYLFKRNKSRADFIRKVARVNYSLKLGIGRLFVEDKNTGKQLYPYQDYLLTCIPSIAVEKAVLRFLSIGVGVNYRYLAKNDVYFKNKDISGPGMFMKIRFSILNSPFSGMNMPYY